MNRYVVGFAVSQIMSLAACADGSASEYAPVDNDEFIDPPTDALEPLGGGSALRTIGRRMTDYCMSRSWQRAQLGFGITRSRFNGASSLAANSFHSGAPEQPDGQPCRWMSRYQSRITYGISQTTTPNDVREFLASHPNQTAFLFLTEGQHAAEFLNELLNFENFQPSRIEGLSLRYAKVTTAALEQVKSASNLKMLDLGTDDHKANVGKHPARLATYADSHRKLLEVLPLLTQLTELDLSHVGVDDAILETLGALPLEKLSLEGNYYIQEWSPNRPLIGFRDQTFTLDPTAVRKSKFTAQGLRQLLSSVPSLRSLNLASTALTNEMVATLAGSSLEELNLRDNEDLTPTETAAVLATMPRLKK